MTDYDIFRLNPSGVIDIADREGFADDPTALAHARALLHPGRVEVWAGRRRVSTLPPAPEPYPA